jgi:peptide/nickel transport system permease protein
MLHKAQGYLETAPWLAVFPGVMIFLTIFCCYVLGEFLRTAWEPERR